MPPVAECLVGAELDEARHGTVLAEAQQMNVMPALARKTISRTAGGYGIWYGMVW